MTFAVHSGSTCLLENSLKQIRTEMPILYLLPMHFRETHEYQTISSFSCISYVFDLIRQHLLRTPCYYPFHVIVAELLGQVYTNCSTLTLLSTTMTRAVRTHTNKNSPWIHETASFVLTKLIGP